MPRIISNKIKYIHKEIWIFLSKIRIQILKLKKKFINNLIYYKIVANKNNNFQIKELIIL
jgi:hypothetical protein